MCLAPGAARPFLEGGQPPCERCFLAQMGTQEHPRHNGHPAGPRRVTGTAADPSAHHVPRRDKSNTWFSGKAVLIARSRCFQDAPTPAGGRGHMKADVWRRGQGETCIPDKPQGRGGSGAPPLLPCLGRRAGTITSRPHGQGTACSQAEEAVPSHSSVFLLQEGESES